MLPDVRGHVFPMPRFPGGAICPAQRAHPDHLGPAADGASRRRQVVGPGCAKGPQAAFQQFQVDEGVVTGEAHHPVAVPGLRQGLDEPGQDILLRPGESGRAGGPGRRQQHPVPGVRRGGQDGGMGPWEAPQPFQEEGQHRGGAQLRQRLAGQAGGPHPGLHHQPQPRQGGSGAVHWRPASAGMTSGPRVVPSKWFRRSRIRTGAW